MLEPRAKKWDRAPGISKLQGSKLTGTEMEPWNLNWGSKFQTGSIHAGT
jgi:hypothetical protein